MKKRYSASALALGLLAALLGVMSIVLDLSAIGLVAGIAGLAAAGLAYVAVAPTEHLTRENNDLRGAVSALEAGMAEQLRARMDAEEHAASLASEAAAEHGRRDINRAKVQRGAEHLTDTDTGLFTEAYFKVAVDARIASARRHLRPVAVGLIDVVEDGRSPDPKAGNPAMVANCITTTLREADTACRLDDGRFAILLEDTPESGAIWTVERIRRAIANDAPGLTLWAGVACYPAHAFDAPEVVERAAAALETARDWHQDRIEVAVVEQ